MSVAKKKKHNRTLITAAVLLAVLLAAAVYTLFFQKDGEESVIIYKETKVQRGDLSLGIMESGSVSFVTQTYDYSVEIDDEDEDDDDDDEEDSRRLKVETVYVAQGQRVKAGDPVLKLTDKSIRSVRRTLRQNAADASILLEEAQNAYELAEVKARKVLSEAGLDAASAELMSSIEQAKLQLEIALARDDIAILTQEIAQIEFDLKDQWEDYDDIREEYEKYRRRYYSWDRDNLYTYVPMRETYLSLKEKYETQKKEREDMRESIQDKQEDIADRLKEAEKLEAGLERKMTDARQSLEKKSLAGSLAEETYALSLRSQVQSIEDAEEELKKYADRLSDFDEFVGEDGIIRAPKDGLIVNIRYSEGTLLKNESPIYEYVEADKYTMSIDVSEEDIPYVKVGDPVDIVFTAYPDESCSGVVSEISGKAGSESTATVNYPVTVRILGNTDKLYSGMTGNVTFVTENVSDVLYISKKAVIRDRGKTCVCIKDEKGGYALKEVTCGFSDASHTEIKEGLAEGDTVYIQSRVSAEEAAGTQADEKTGPAGDGKPGFAGDGKSGFGGNDKTGPGNDGTEEKTKPSEGDRTFPAGDGNVKPAAEITEGIQR